MPQPGWCAQIGADSGYYSAKIDESAARSLYPDLDAVTAGWLTPGGNLEVCDGGYRLSGRWSFGSGVTHADVIVGGAQVTRTGRLGYWLTARRRGA
jgi:indole-3-acetate monooxygenase